MIYQGELQITEKYPVARDTILLRFKVTSLKDLKGTEVDPERFTFTPGQFISLQFTEKAWRAYSVASLPEEPLELVVRLIPGGVGSEALRASKVGDCFPFKGPFGHFTLSDTPNAKLYFCGTGTGIAPLRSMIRAESKKANPREMTLFYGGRNLEDIAYTEELEQWGDLQIFLGLSRDPEAEKHHPKAKHCRITAFLESQNFPKEAEFYICGNGGMVKSVQEILEGKGIPKSQIFAERFN